MAVFKLHNYQQACQLIDGLLPRIKARLQSGNVLTLTIEEPKKSREQEEKYHAMIGEIAKQAQHLGASWTNEEWKRLLVEQFCRDTDRKPGKVVPSLDGGAIVQLGVQTRNFSKEDGSEFIEWLHAWGSENGITFKE